MAVGLWLLLRDATLRFVEWSEPLPVLTAASLGVASAGITRRVSRPALLLGMMGAACAAFAMDAAVDAYGFLGPSPFDDTAASVFLALGPVILYASATLAASWSERGLAVASGLVFFASSRFEGPLLVFALLGAALVASDRQQPRVPMADRLSHFALGVIGWYAVTGIAEDAAVTVAPALEWHLRWWTLDDPVERSCRMAAEAGTLVGAMGFLRGRTWGWLVLAPAGVGMAACAMWFRGPMWGGGCLAHGHVLRDDALHFLGFLAIALLRWLAPITRALVGVVRAERRSR